MSRPHLLPVTLGDGFRANCVALLAFPVSWAFLGQPTEQPHRQASESSETLVNGTGSDCDLGKSGFVDFNFPASISEISVQFSRSVVSSSLQPHGLQYTRPPCPSPTPGVYSNSCAWSQ